MFDQNYFISAAAADADDDDDNKTDRAVTNDIEAVTFQFLYQLKMISLMDTFHLCR